MPFFYAQSFATMHMSTGGGGGGGMPRYKNTSCRLSCNSVGKCKKKKTLTALQLSRPRGAVVIKQQNILIVLSFSLTFLGSQNNRLIEYTQHISNTLHSPTPNIRHVCMSFGFSKEPSHWVHTTIYRQIPYIQPLHTSFFLYIPPDPLSSIIGRCT